MRLAGRCEPLCQPLPCRHRFGVQPRLAVNQFFQPNLPLPVSQLNAGQLRLYVVQLALRVVRLTAQLVGYPPVSLQVLLHRHPPFKQPFQHHLGRQAVLFVGLGQLAPQHQVLGQSGVGCGHADAHPAAHHLAVSLQQAIVVGGFDKKLLHSQTV